MAKEDSSWKDIFEYIYSGRLNEEKVVRFVRKTRLRPDFFSVMLEYISIEATAEEIGRAKHLLDIIFNNAQYSALEQIQNQVQLTHTSHGTHIVAVELVHYAFLIILEKQTYPSILDWVFYRSYTLVMAYLQQNGEKDTRLVDIVLPFYRKIWKMLTPFTAHSQFRFLYHAICFTILHDGPPNGMKKRFLELSDEIVQNPLFYVLNTKFLAEWKKSQIVYDCSGALSFHFIHLSKSKGRLVYAPNYFFIQTLPLANILLDSKDGEEVEKGLEIVEFTLFGVKSLNKYHLAPLLLTVKCLTVLMTQYPDVTYRKKALEAFEGIIKEFDETAQYLLFIKLYNDCCCTSGPNAYLLPKIKKKMAEHPSENWKGKKAADLLKLYDCTNGKNECVHRI